MHWVAQNGRKYLYTTRRVGSRVVRTYLGTGQKAEQIAAEDKARRKRERDEAAIRHEADRRLGELSRALAVLLESAHLLAGYHRHDRGTWRKKRVSRSNEHCPKKAEPR